MGLRASNLSLFEWHPSLPKQKSTGTSCWQHNRTPPSYNHNWTDLHYAASQGNLQKIQKILKESGEVDLNKKDYYGKTPLYWAAYKGHTVCVEELLNSGAMVNTYCRHGGTPLHTVVSLYPECASLLIKHGADVNLTDHWGVTPMYLAATNVQLDVICYLKLAGAKLTYRNKKTGDVPKHLACHREFCEYLSQEEQNPPSLQQLCRLKTRKLLGEHPLAKIQKLPLPPILKQFLELDELR